MEVKARNTFSPKFDRCYFQSAEGSAVQWAGAGGAEAAEDGWEPLQGEGANPACAAFPSTWLRLWFWGCCLRALGIQM